MTPLPYESLMGEGRFDSLELLRLALAPTLDAVPGSAPTGTKRAAVAAILRDGPTGPEVLFIRRAEREGDPWSGHMAFPGGRYETSDADLLTTARRETLEEIGVDLMRDARLIGMLEDQTPSSGRRGISIRPFVFELTTPAEFHPNEEVSEVFFTPVAPLFEGKHQSSIEVDYEQVRYTLPAYDLEGRVVWGLTYRMLQMLLLRWAPPSVADPPRSE